MLITKESGKHFDPQIITIFEKIVNDIYQNLMMQLKKKFEHY